MEPESKNWRDYVGRFSVSVDLTNRGELILAQAGYLPLDRVHRATISGTVDTVPPGWCCRRASCPPWG